MGTRALLGVVCALMLVAPAAATAEDQVDPQLDYLTTNLSLTGEQRDAVAHILSTDRQLAKLDHDHLGDQSGQLDTAAGKRVADTYSEMEQKLTDEQRAKLTALGAGTALSRRTRMLAGRLGLDAVQAMRINEMVRQAGMDRPPQGEPPGGTDAQGGAEQDRSARMADMRDRMEKLDARIATVLTPEQKTEYDRLRAENRERMQQQGDHRGPGMGGGHRGHGGGGW